MAPGGPWCSSHQSSTAGWRSAAPSSRNNVLIACDRLPTPPNARAQAPPPETDACASMISTFHGRVKTEGVVPVASSDFVRHQLVQCLLKAVCATSHDL